MSYMWKIFCMDKDDENYTNRKKVKDHCHHTGTFRGAAYSKCNLNYKVLKDIPIIIDITFSVPIKKECDNGKTITHNLKFIDSFRFMSTSLSELVDNMSGIFNSIELKSCIEKIKINSECCFAGLKNNRLIYKYKECKEEWKRPINELIEKFPSIYIL